jgi:outer membrane protein OmpA-like peptidoglycan-associated protein
MKTAKDASSVLMGLALVASLSACASTNAGPNAGAAAVAAPQAAAPPPLVSKPSLGQEAGAVASNKVVIEFPSGGARLTAEANKQLDLAARLFRDANPVLMFSTGHTDRTGDEYANILLSAKRAQAVKMGLVARGIPADRLLLQALGESELANTRDPNAAENRRVTITWRLL